MSGTYEVYFLESHEHTFVFLVNVLCLLVRLEFDVVLVVLLVGFD